jgi:hypothetical protein
MKPNTKFSLDVKDIALIEKALQELQSNLSNNDDKRRVVDLLAKIYHQKVWYRPKENYVSG